MPKIGRETGPSYIGHEGLVVDARDVEHQVDPTRQLNGEPTEGLEVHGEPDATEGRDERDVQPEREDGDRDENDTPRDLSEVRAKRESAENGPNVQRPTTDQDADPKGDGAVAGTKTPAPRKATTSAKSTKN